MNAYLKAYGELNTAQRQAVDAIDGPVMVIAGPGTGKTEVLALRIAHILTKTDTPPDGVLCLTFTTAGVKAMRERLMRYIGSSAMKVRISTFHSFALDVLAEYHANLGFEAVSTLLDDSTAVSLFDEILRTQDWKYLRSRSNISLYYRDLKSTISSLKRDRITPEQFKQLIEVDIVRIEQDPESISSRGETKGEFKKDVQKKLEGLLRTLEVAEFYAKYEAIKRERHYIDYNDVLELLVQLVKESDEVRDTLRERYLYALIDEHQDSSGIQNEFLLSVWQDTERPNLFVVGDDRQLIYGFGGASINYFESFKHSFGKVELITLTQNYRSTQVILDTAEALLQSKLAEGKLVGNTKSSQKARLTECDYPRDEIIRAGLDIKEKTEYGATTYDKCAILVPKNRHVKSAIETLKDIGIPVAAESSLRLFDLPETMSFLAILQAVAHPFDIIALNRTLLDNTSNIPPFIAHKFLYEHDPKKNTIDTLIDSDDKNIHAWGEQLRAWVDEAQKHDAYQVIQIIADESFIGSIASDEDIRRRVEIVRTLLHLALSQTERGEKVTLSAFLEFIDRLQEYGEDIALSVFGRDKGVKVLTMHGSKGLEFDAVWIAHMDERSFMSAKRNAFVLPVALSEQLEKEDDEVKKRELYVAMTRARLYLTISYARMSYSGVTQLPASIIATLPQELFEVEKASVSEEKILHSDTKLFVTRHEEEKKGLEHIITLVADNYESRKISVTLLNNFFECPWKWYFRSLLQLPEPLTESLHIGNVVHKSIEHVLKGKDDVETYMEGCAAKEARYDEELKRNIIRQALPVVKKWMGEYEGTLAQPFWTEKSYSYVDPDFSHLIITGKIDVVEEIITAEVRVTDWKTGSVKTKSEIEKVDEEGRMSSYLRQLAMYAYLIEGTTSGGVSVDEARLVFVEAKDMKSAIVSRKITSEEIQRLREDIKDYCQQIESGEWIRRKCNTKTYNEADVCEYCTMAKRFGVLGTQNLT